MSFRTSVITVTSLAAVTVLAGSAVTYAQVPEVAEPVKGNTLSQAYLTTAQNINETATDATHTLSVLNTKIAEAEVEPVKTEVLTNLYNTMKAESDALTAFTPVNIDLGPSTGNISTMAPISFQTEKGATYRALLTPLNVSAPESVTAWDTELAAEKERIRIAEEERIRQEEAARQAEIARQAQIEKDRQAANTQPSTRNQKAPRNTQNSTPAPSTGSAPTAPAPAPAEDAYGRAARVMGTLPFSIAFTLSDECDGAARVLGCYSMGNSISLAPRMLNDPRKYPDCKVKHTIAHEYRHYLQKQEGSIQWDESGTITNRDWLESDANAWAASYGC